MRTLRSLALLSLALALPAMAQGVPAAPSPEGRPHGRLLERLGLAESQKPALQAITARHRPSLGAKRAAAREASRAFYEALARPGTPPEALKALGRARADARMEVLLERRAMHQEMLQLLAPDQRVQAAWAMGRGEGLREGRGADPAALQGLVEEVRRIRAVVDEIHRPPSVQDTFARKFNGS
jgi:Spy/CpxP family protein refolding chaperone